MTAPAPPRDRGVGWNPDDPVQVVPNPIASGQRLNVRVPDWPAFPGPAIVRLYDGVGRELAACPVDPKTGEASLDLTNLAGGVFVVCCARHAKKVMVQQQGRE